MVVSNHAQQRIQERLGDFSNRELIEHLAVSWEASDAGMQLFRQRRGVGYSYRLCLVKGILTMFILGRGQELVTVLTADRL